MLPIQIEQRFANPGRIEQEFMNFLHQAKLKNTLDKTIASVSYFDQKSIGGGQNARFFDGAHVATGTNMPASFQLPESEHAVIYGIRLSSVVSLTPATATYTPGTSGDGTLENSLINCSINGVSQLADYIPAEALSGLTTKDDGLILLDEPFVWPAQTTLKLTLDGNSGAVWTTNLCVRMTLLGLGLVS